MLNIDPTHIAWRCGTEDQTRRVVSDLEGALAEAKARRDKILADISKANVAAFAGDRRQLFALTGRGGLNKQDAEVGRLILSISKQLGEARKRLATIEAHAAQAAAHRAGVDDAGLVRDKWFETICPDGRKVRHRHHSLEALRRELQPGYRATGQVFGANEDGSGGFVADADSHMMKALLESQGDVLMEWLNARGIVSGEKTMIVLPGNGRAAQ